MAVRIILALLLGAVVWAAARPARVAVDPDASHDPEAWADAMDLPEPFDPPRRTLRHGIDPTPHRAAIDRIEAVLYRRSPIGYGDAGTVEGEAIRLAGDLLGTDRMRGQRAGSELRRFAARVGGAADVGYVLPRLPDLRRDWEAVRASVFAPADWMRTASADLDRIQDPPPPSADPRTDAVLAEAARELERLLVRGQRDVERLGEPRYDPEVPSRTLSPQIRAWYDWGECWRTELIEVMAPVHGLQPPPDPDREPLRAATVRSLVEAAEMLRRIPDGAGMWPTPFRGSWETRFRAANDALAEARHRLAAILGAS